MELSIYQIQKKAQKQTCEYIHTTQNEDGSFSANVCVICEWYIIGSEELYWTSSKLIFQNRHRLSINIWEKINGVKIPSNLQSQ